MNLCACAALPNMCTFRNLNMNVFISLHCCPRVFDKDRSGSLEVCELLELFKV